MPMVVRGTRFVAFVFPSMHNSFLTRIELAGAIAEWAITLDDQIVVRTEPERKATIVYVYKHDYLLNQPFFMMKFLSDKLSFADNQSPTPPIDRALDYADPELFEKLAASIRKALNLELQNRSRPM